MDLTRRAETPLGPVLLASHGSAITGLWFMDQRYFACGLEEGQQGDAAVFRETEAWLERYFRGLDPGKTPELAPRGTPFQRESIAKP